MRKIIIPVLVLICILSGCTEKGTSSLILNSVSFSADIQYNGERYAADCVIDGQRELSVSINFPENLTGVNLLCGNGGCKILYNGMEISGQDGLFPQASAIGIIKQILDAADGREFNVSKGNGKVTGKQSGREYSVTASPGGLPISLEIPDMDFKMLFNNVSLI